MPVRPEWLLLEADQDNSSVRDRMVNAVERAEQGIASGEFFIPLPPNNELYPEQWEVCANFVAHLRWAHENVYTHPMVCYQRVIATPRVGKTVMMAAFIALTGARTLVIVPTEALVVQTIKELKSWLPGVPIDAYYGASHKPQRYGVTVATYESIARHSRSAKLPVTLRGVLFVFADEAHEAMTNYRIGSMMNSFALEAVRVAFTATEDYDNDRQLRRYFPYLIKEITVKDSKRAGRLSHAHCYVDYLNVDASRVHVRKSKLDDGELDAIMAMAPFWEQALQLRYQVSDDPRMHHRARGAIICCRTKTQAKYVLKHFLEHRPKGTSEPRLITDETPGHIRDDILEKFDAGEIDTIIQVRILNRGWNAKRCKLMIDMAPSFSQVEAKQKYFRVMTKFGDEEAYIYVLLPVNLPRLPLFPGDVLGDAVTMHMPTSVWLEIQKKRLRQKREDENPGRKRITKVEVESEAYVDDGEPQRPLMNCPDLVREIIMTRVPDPLRRIPMSRAFARLEFVHPFFVGTGEKLMWWCGSIRPGTKAYVRWMYRLFPGPGAYRHLRRANFEFVQADLDVEAAYIMGTEFRPGTRQECCELEGALRAYAGGQPLLNAEGAFAYLDGAWEVEVALRDLASERKLAIMQMHYLEDVDFDELAVIVGIPKGHVDYEHLMAIRELRKNRIRYGV